MGWKQLYLSQVYVSMVPGQVEIEIDLENGKTLEFKTSPVNVAIIMAFQEKGTVSHNLLLYQRWWSFSQYMLAENTTPGVWMIN